MLTSRNPYTGAINATFDTLGDDQLTSKIEQAHTAYLARRQIPKAEKKQLFLRMADLMDERHEQLALLETQEMGMLYDASKKWLRNTAHLIRRNANNVEQVLADELFDHDGMQGHIQYDPIGVIYGIAPWNFPFNQLLRAAVPNILAGNTVLYKHASNVPLCLQAIQHLFDDAWFPSGVFTALYINADQSAYIIAHNAIQWVNITGSDAACSHIWSLASTHLKPSVVEWWGNDAFILLDHDDMHAMVASATACRISYGGQKCNSSKRYIILDHHYEAFIEAFAAHMAAQIVWDPMDPATQLWPLSSNKLMQEIHHQVQKSIDDGVRLVTGGIILDHDRNLYAPTVLADVTPEMTCFREEIFGPVASVIRSSSIEQSIQLANMSQYWLSATVRWDNPEQCKTVARQLDGGMIFINNPAGSKASLPFWWVKKSGYGKENGPDGLKSFTNRKVVLY